MSVHTTEGVRCGNRRQHGADVVYHVDSDAVRDCYAESGRFQSHQREQALVDRMVNDPAPIPVPSEDEARALARNARYAAWRTIPVYSRDRGYYALEVDGEVKFYRIERPSKGKYRGRTFVSVQASDVFHKMESWEAGARVMDAIAADPTTAARRYGQMINHCSRCNRTLTDTVSRERGMGPDCAEKAW